MMKFRFLVGAWCILILFGCGEDTTTELAAPQTYTFLRDGNSTVSFTGQTTRILMAEELVSALNNSQTSEERLLLMFRNKDINGNDVDPFELTELNASTKSIQSKVAASRDFFFTNTTERAQITAQFEAWIAGQVNEVFINEEVLASPGIPGQIADGTNVRYINAKGIEYNQVFSKSLMGALMLDQIVNNYLSPAILDEADNRENNDSGILEENMPYTTMEHKWDEAYGYLFGLSMTPENPLENLGFDDSFLNEYVGKVDKDVDFSGIGQEIFDAFKLGRAAIVAKEYELRDHQADIIKEKLSEVVAIRTVYYLQQGKNALAAGENLSQFGPAFHDLSEGLGFIYSLRFTRKSGTNESYFSRSEVDDFMNSMVNNSPNGLWDMKGETLDTISKTIADKFSFNIAQAAE